MQQGCDPQRPHERFRRALLVHRLWRKGRREKTRACRRCLQGMRGIIFQAAVNLDWRPALLRSVRETQIRGQKIISWKSVGATHWRLNRGQVPGACALIVIVSEAKDLERQCGKRCARNLLVAGLVLCFDA